MSRRWQAAQGRGSPVFDKKGLVKRELANLNLSYKLHILFITIKGLAMANNSAPKSAKQSDSATSASSAAVPKTPSPAAKTTAKTTARPAAKPAVKPAAKPTPIKAAEKPTSKPAAAPEAAKKDESTKADKIAKPKKAKLVRDSFTMPESEHDLIAAVKMRCVAKGLAVKKSEVLRAAIIGFAAKSDAAVMVALQALKVIKTGRPLKGHK
jgi:type IV secretory pathway VirB10-like protein